MRDSNCCTGEEIGDIDELGVRFLNNKRIEGTLNEMLDETIGFCMRNMKTQTVIHPENGKREDIPEYPINAIREAVLNALIHRDYSVHTEGTPVQICFFFEQTGNSQPWKSVRKDDN